MITLNWLIGNNLTSFIIYIATYFIPICWQLLLIIMIIQLIISIILRKKTHKALVGQNRNVITFPVERFPSLHFLIFFSSIIFLIYSTKILPNSTNSINSNTFLSFSTDYSLITSILEGCNRKRKSFLYLTDPTNSSLYYTNSVSALMYPAVFCYFGLSYSSATLLISYMNIISTVVGIYMYVSVSNYQIISSLYFLFNTSWYFILQLITKDSANLRESIGSNIGCLSPPLIPFLSSLSSEISISIPMAMFGLSFGFLTDFSMVEIIYIAILVGIMIPNSLISVCFFLSLLAAPQYKLFIAPAIVPFIRLFKTSLTFGPLWNIYGISQTILFIPYINILGPICIFSIPVYFAENSKTAKKKLISTILPILFCLFFTQGESELPRIAALISVVLPPMVLTTYQYIERRIKKLFCGIENARTVLNIIMTIIISLGLYSTHIYSKIVSHYNHL